MNTEAGKHLEYASGYMELEMFDDALREVDAALALEPKHPRALAMKSAILWRQNRLAEAEPYVAALAEMNPRDAALWVNLAYIRRRTHSLEAAVETLQHAFEANPCDALAHFNMACYRALQDRPEEALALLQNAIALDPSLRELAKTEPDFQKLRGLAAFQKLIGGEQ